MIRLLREEDAAAYAALRRRSLIDHPLIFTASPEDDFVGSEEAVRTYLRDAPDSVILGAFDPALVGFAGLHRDRPIKAAHRITLWGFYVVQERRGHGLADALLSAAIAHARSLDRVQWILLSVSTDAPAARRLYERAGFVEWGTEPDALRHEGRSVDERHMALRL